MKERAVMRRAMVVLIVSSLVLAGMIIGGEMTAAQTGATPVSTSAQLQLPSSAFPSDYPEGGNEAWTPANADGSTIGKEHVKSYTQLGMLGAWYEYHAKAIMGTIQGVMV